MSEGLAKVSPYADEHGLRRVLPEHAVEHAQSTFRWHEFRPWIAPHLTPHPPTDDACGACGKPESVHPIPWSTMDGYAGGALMVALGLAPDIGSPCPACGGEGVIGICSAHRTRDDGCETCDRPMTCPTCAGSGRSDDLQAHLAESDRIIFGEADDA